MITLYQFQPAFGLPNPSSFCLKVETYLKMTGVPYQVAADADIRKAPKGKLPYIQDGDRTIADSNFIIDHLKQTYGDPLDQHLTPAEHAIALAFQRLMEENLYWVAFYGRWFEDENWPAIRETFFGDLPPILRSIVPNQVRKDAQRNLYGHGIGRHTREEIYEIGKRDLHAISDFLADKPFLMGEQPTSVDASGYGLLANLMRSTLPLPLTDYAQQFENLGAYCDRMQSRFWS